MREKVLITAKISPDLDGVACGIGYCDYLNQIDKDKRYFVGFEGDVQIEVEYALENTKVKYSAISNDKFSKFILVDTSSTKGIPAIVDPKGVVEIIDHRSGGIEYEAFPYAKPQVELVGAAATLIAEKYYFNKVDLSRECAMLFYLAVFSNTLNLKASVTTYRDLRVVKWLEGEYSGCKKRVVESMLDTKTRNILNNLEFALISDSKQIKMGGEYVGVYQLELNNTEGLNSEKINDIREVLGREKGLDWAFCTIADIRNGRNIIISTDNNRKIKISKALGADDEGKYLVTNELLLRKEIVPKLRVYFD